MVFDREWANTLVSSVLAMGVGPDDGLRVLCGVRSDARCYMLPEGAFVLEDAIDDLARQVHAQP